MAQPAAGSRDAQHAASAPGARTYLRELLHDDGRLIVVSNRGPLRFRQRRNGAWLVERGFGGLVTALAEVGRYAPVTWVATAMESGDRSAARLLRSAFRNGQSPEDGAAAAARAVRDGTGDTAPALPNDTGRGVRASRRAAARPGENGGWSGSTRAASSTLDAQRAALLAAIAAELPEQDLQLDLCEVPDAAYEAHYARFSNPFLWFLQHEMYALPYEPHVDDELVTAWNNGYRVVNALLAQKAIEAAGPARPVVLLQDYHLYLAAWAIRAARPDSLLLHFTHIPWPAEATWQLLPQGLRRAVCEGLLANDIVGFQTDGYATNFLRTVARFVHDARVDPDGRNVRWRDRTIWVRSYPISVDPAALSRFARSPAVEAQRRALQERLERAGRPRLIVRVDRLEPSKNVYRGFLAFEALLRRRPDLRDRVRFLAVVSFSRAHLPEYRQYAAAVREVVARINGLADPESAPVWLVDGSDYAMAIAALTLADVVLVNPLIDGMNLVAKEAVLVGDPVLVLSETAGAAEQLAADALTVAAVDIAGTTKMLETALEMPRQERQRRISHLRASVREENLEWWLTRQLRDLAAVSAGGRPPSRRLRDTMRRSEAAFG